MLLVLYGAHVLVELEKDLLRHVFRQPGVAHESVCGAEDGAVVQRESLVEAWSRRSPLNRLWH